MSLNKFMHPRNKYRKPPDFKSLAIKYPDFRKYAKQDISGKVSLDFKNLESIRALTCTLLKEDFNLDVEIPLDRLIPTLPLRLNYLLWIEDILIHNKITEVVKGIDIGCGASCVYPLLAAKNFGWCMLATEKDVDSAQIAISNVQKNSLEGMIKVKTVEEGIMLEGVVDINTCYDFCMCNPPFFSCVEELQPEHVARSPNRHPPRNAHSGAPGELIAPGGETAFITKVIHDSIKLNKLVRVYTVMVGHKSSVNKVKQSLQEFGVTQVACTEFCQGHTTRWGIAWTLDPEIQLPQVKDVPLSNKKKAPFSHTCSLNLMTTVKRLHQLMAELQIKYTTMKNNTELNAMEICAMTNTWSHSRKKRRQEKFKESDHKDKNDEKTNLDPINKSNMEKSSDNLEEIILAKINNKDQTDTITKTEGKFELEEKIGKEKHIETLECKNYKRSRSEDMECPESTPSKKFKADINSVELNGGMKKEPFMYGSLIVRRKGESSVIELCWLRGAGGRDAAHQVLQYFKNNLEPH